MLVLSQDQKHIYDTDKFDHFHIDKTGEVIRLSSPGDRAFPLGIYEKKEAQEVLFDFLRAWADGEEKYEMPPSCKAPGMQEPWVRDARTKRKGGS